MMYIVNWNDKSLKFIGLSDKERALLNLLKSPLSIQDASKLSPIPRTTITFVLKRLCRLGFIKKSLSGKRFKYFSIKSDKLEQLLNEGIVKIKGIDLQISNKKNIFFHKNSRDIISLLERMMINNQDERFYTIQSNKSWQSMHKNAGIKGVIAINRSLVENRIIMEAIIEPNAYKLFEESFNKNIEYADLVKSFIGRMADYSFVPENLLIQCVDLWLVSGTTLFINWEKEFAWEIVDTEIYNFLLDMFKISKSFSKRVDHNKSMTDMLN